MCAQLLVKIAAKFNTSLNLKTAIGATTATLDSATDDSGVALPTGRYALTIDGGTSSEEFITCTLTSTALTSIKHVTMQGVETSGTTIVHRKGATVKITDFAVIKKMLDLLDGTTSFDSATPLGYDGTATISTANQFATKAYVDGVAIAGGADASTTVKGITKMSVAPASAASPIAVGDNDPRVPTTDENDALVGNNTDIAVGTGNMFVTQTGLQKNAESYAATATGNDTYVITLSPVPTSLVNGMHLKFKADVANTGAATLNVNSLGAVSLVTGLSTALATGDIVANQVVEVVYNSTGPVFQVLNPASAIIVAPVFDYTLNSITDNATYFTTTVPVLPSSASGVLGWTASSLSIPTTAGAAGYNVLGSSGGTIWSISTLIPGTGSSVVYTPSLTGKELRLKNSMRFGGTTQRVGFGISVSGATIYSAITDITDGTIRFVTSSGAIYAHNSNGTTATSTDVTGGRTLTDRHVYEIVYNPGTDIKFYIDGTLVATHTTNMPTSGNLSIAMGASASGQTLESGHPILTIKQ